MSWQSSVCMLSLALATSCHRTSTPSFENVPPSSSAIGGSGDRTAPGKTAASATAAPSEWSPPLFAGSIYDLDAVLVDENGKKVSLDVFRGHPVLITMFYSACPNACPLLTSDLKRIDRQLAQGVRGNVRVLMVSFDAEHDTPQVLENHARNHQLDRARWKLASAKDDTARELAGVLGIKYRKVDGGQYFHTSAILLLDENGRPKIRVEGLGKDPAPILAALR